uniref:LAGLIDADG endonuclease n=1 Tax=Clavaria fumosa TaxID=264083 RepID=A0A7T3PCN8_9AGAR|nr:LAGLIDADG endonuclease [Clavaria fumosa]QPZ51076.1 LAGLIDADG endonuclease [Clavaria fumosa]
MINLRTVLIGFFSKQFVLYSAVQSGYIFISIVAILVSVISASYYLKIIKVLLDMNDNNSITIKNTNASLKKAKIKQYLLKNPSSSINNLKKCLLVKYANITNKKNNLDLIHTNYFKEMQLLFILIFILKFDLTYKNINKSNSSNNLNYYTKDFYINKELWLFNTSNFNSLPLNNLNNNKERDISYYYNNNNYNNPELNNKLKSDLLYQLSNFHSFLISNLTLIIILFIFKPAKRCGNTLLWVKLPNSGNTLKLLIPNYIWKSISGWSNYSCKVISYKIFEKIMGYRGSKSEFNIKSVKEQRVNGNWWIKSNLSHLRYTLMGSEKNYQIKIPSKQLNKISYSTLDNKPKFLTPWFISGLIDGEGSFSISIYKSNEHKLHWGVRTVFVIDLHEWEYFLLLKLQEYFGGIGTIYRNKVRNTVNYSVAGIQELKNIIIPHF